MGSNCDIKFALEIVCMCKYCILKTIQTIYFRHNVQIGKYRIQHLFSPN